MYEDDPAPSSPPKDSPPKEIPAENLIYEITDDSVTILGYPYLNQAGKDGGAWAIPAQIKGLPVTRIGPDAFSNGGMGHLTVPNSVVTIERSAFQSMDNLVSVVIGDSVENLGAAVFSFSDRLRRVTFLGDAPQIPRGIQIPRRVLVLRKPESKGWRTTFGGATVKPPGEASSEESIAATEPSKSGKRFPASTKELMFGSNPVVTDKDKAFWEAAKSGKLEAVQRLLSEGVDVNIYGSTIGVDFGCTALFWAAKHNHKEVVQLLLEKDAYIDAGAGMGGAPLHIAAYEGHSEIVELLISEGANTEAKTGDGETVFDFANEEIAELIRKSIEEK